MRGDTRSLRLVASFGALLLANCSSGTGPSAARLERRPALLSFYADSATVTLPDTVSRLQPVTVAVTSYGGGCITQGETDVAVSDLLAVIRPYRYEVTGSHAFCEDAVRLFQHVATIQFAKAGQAEVRVIGERRPGDDQIELVRTVAVVP